jgi:hypothetical protein
MKVKGKIVKLLPKQNGESKKTGKQWVKQELIINTGVDYNPEICITFFGEEKISMLNSFNVNDMVDVSINLHSREWNNKYFHTIDGWKIEKANDNNDMPF